MKISQDCQVPRARRSRNKCTSHYATSWKISSKVVASCRRNLGRRFLDVGSIPCLFWHYSLKPAARTILPGDVLQHRDKTKRSVNLQLKWLLSSPKVSSNLSQVLLQLMLTMRLFLHTLPITGTKEEISSREKTRKTQQHREINSALVCGSIASWATTGRRCSPFRQHWARPFCSSTGMQRQSSYCELQIK